MKNAQRASGRRHCNTLAHKTAPTLNGLRITRIIIRVVEQNAGEGGISPSPTILSSESASHAA